MTTITSSHINTAACSTHGCPTGAPTSCRNALVTTLIPALPLNLAAPTADHIGEAAQTDSSLFTSYGGAFPVLSLPHLAACLVPCEAHCYHKTVEPVESLHRSPTDELISGSRTACCCTETRPESPRCIRTGATTRTITSSSTAAYTSTATTATITSRPNISSNVPATTATITATVESAAPVDSPDSAPMTKITSAMFRDDELLPLLACKHWLEVMDPRHRYGTYLRPYYDEWLSRGCPGADNGDDNGFFTWLDSDEGRQIDLLRSPSATTRRARPRHVVSRPQLDRCVVRYCDSQSRNKFRVEVDSSLTSWENSGENASDLGIHKPPVLRWAERPGKPLVHTQDGRGGRWIFVVDRLGRMFLNRKVKAAFHHSSFVQGDAVRAAGRIDVVHGVVTSVAPNSGHYMTSMPHLLKGLHDVFGDCELPVTSFTTCDST